MKIVFVVNNKNSRLGKLLPKLEEDCQRAKLGNLQFLTTLREKHAIELAKNAAENGCDYVIAVGGDGTLNEVINGVLKSDISANAYPTIGLLPYGSANDFARTAQISNAIEELIELIKSNTSQKIDLGKIKEMLGVPIIGIIPEDEKVSKAQQRNIPVIYGYPNSLASRAIQEIAFKLR